MAQTNSSLAIVIFWFLAAALAVLGLVFMIAAGQGNAVIRFSIGGFCLISAGAMVYLARQRPVQHTHVHKMELEMPGKTELKAAECRSCGAALDSKSVSVVAGAVHVNCPYCGSSYQLEEAPKW